jgi:hypothetical protein
MSRDTINLAGFCRGGNSLKLWIHCPKGLRRHEQKAPANQLVSVVIGLVLGAQSTARVIGSQAGQTSAADAGRSATCRAEPPRVDLLLPAR